MMTPNEMVKYLREKADAFDYQGWVETAIDYERAADVIEELSKRVEGLEAAQEISSEAQYFVDTKADKIIDGLQDLLASVKERPRWIPVTERLPEESEGLDWHEDLMIRFTSVWCCDAKTGTLEVRNRLQGKMTGNEFLDQYTKDTDYHWSKSWWVPTHWMPIVPLPEPPKEDA